MPTIRRYANRKFYYLESHRYVNLKDIAGLIRAGQEVRVLEHPGGRDITTEVLAQVIVQERPSGLDSFLTALIRFGRYPLEEAVRRILAGLGLPTRAQWQELEGEVTRLEALLRTLLDEDESRML
jgi:polyhydroxyalkanoate synthesis repressor PhaR